MTSLCQRCYFSFIFVCVCVCLFHPLHSDIIQSPWLKFFQNEEMKKDIQRDIDRTYPEMEFFQQEDTRRILLHVLFIYARHHPHIEYKQVSGQLIYFLC